MPTLRREVNISYADDPYILYRLYNVTEEMLCDRRKRSCLAPNRQEDMRPRDAPLVKARVTIVSENRLNAGALPSEPGISIVSEEELAD
jgi:hypothetical protein